jgi:hypothetical protein
MDIGRSRTRQAARALLLTGAATTALLAAAGCATTKPHSERRAAAAAAPITLPDAEVGLSVDHGGSPETSGSGDGGAGGGSGGNGRVNSGGGQASPAASQTSGTQIVYFRVKQQPKCEEGTDVYRSPAVPAIIEWKVTGATKVALSVDNPNLVGAYQTYDGTQGSETFTFSCGGPAGSTETHQYTINTIGGGTKKMTISASVKVPEKATPVT